MTTSAAAAAPKAAIPPRVYGALVAGIIAVSMAAIFIGLAQREGVPSLVIAAGRVLISALLLTPVALRFHGDVLKALRRADLLLLVFSGIFLGFHFACWILSLEYTSVLISVVFVGTGPLWVALLEFVFLGARINRLIALGLALALAGGIIIGVTGTDGGSGSQPVLGAGLALAGAMAFAAYLVIGRKLRAKLPLVPYIWLVYSSTAICLLVMILVTGTPVTGYPLSGFGWVVLTALIPQLIGHSSFNFALRYLSATYVSIATQLEPIASAFMAFFVFKQVPTFLQAIGSLIILTGVTLASIGQSKRTPAQPETENPK